MSQKPDLERVLNFLTGGELDTEPRANQPAPNAAPENVEPGDLQAPRGAEPKDDGSSSHQSVASVRISIDGGDERRFVKYVPRQNSYPGVKTNTNLLVENSTGTKYLYEPHNRHGNKRN